jgi:hypothetical protein
VSDDPAHERRNAVIAQLKAGALDAAARAPRPNPRVFVLAEKISALADDYRTGRKQLDPRARVIADQIRAHAERIRRSRHNP